MLKDILAKVKNVNVESLILPVLVGVGVLGGLIVAHALNNQDSSESEDNGSVPEENIWLNGEDQSTL